MLLVIIMRLHTSVKLTSMSYLLLYIYIIIIWLGYCNILALDIVSKNTQCESCYKYYYFVKLQFSLFSQYPFLHPNAE